MSIFVYTNIITSRLQYITNFVSGAFFNNQLQIINDIEIYKSAEGYKINYSAERLASTEFHIQPINLLSEKNNAPQTIECFDWQGVKVFFRTGGDLSFDIFAATFYCISRYEEYLPHTIDEFGRYAHINSVAYKEHFLQLPLVNIWWRKLIELFQKKYQQQLFDRQQQAFEFTPTYDIDIAYSHLAKGILRTAGGLVKAGLKGDWQAAQQKINVLTNKAKDPFDTYDFLHALHLKYKLQPVYFFLLAKQHKVFDKNNNPHTARMQQLMQQHAKIYATGIHPSWQSGDDFNLLLQEIQTLEQVTEKPVTTSRQHYIRITLPYTYRQLIKANIINDYSMGYGSINGFRASVASPFYWYDLEKETQTNLLIHSFCYMEANSYFEQHYTTEEAAKELQYYYNITKQVNGKLITIFHNHFITEQPEWLPWRNMYEAFLSKNFQR